MLYEESERLHNAWNMFLDSQDAYACALMHGTKKEQEYWQEQITIADRWSYIAIHGYIKDPRSCAWHMYQDCAEGIYGRNNSEREWYKKQIYIAYAWCVSLDIPVAHPHKLHLSWQSYKKCIKKRVLLGVETPDTTWEERDKMFHANAAITNASYTYLDLVGKYKPAPLY